MEKLLVPEVLNSKISELINKNFDKTIELAEAKIFNYLNKLYKDKKIKINGKIINLGKITNVDIRLKYENRFLSTYFDIFVTITFSNKYAFKGLLSNGHIDLIYVRKF